MKEIEATDSYLGLDQDVKKCQNIEPLHNCTTRKYLEAVLAQCKCLPSNLWLSNMVRHNKNLSSCIRIMIFKEPLCSAQKLECANAISVDTSSCMKPCSGLIVTSFFKSENYKDVKLLYPKIWRQYNNFKTISTFPSGLIGT